MNILITAIGSFSAEAVIKCLKKNPLHKIVATDINPAEWLVNSKVVDKMYQCPLASNAEKYLQKIIEICQQESIEFIIPLTDPEVDVLSEHNNFFKKKNITLCISDPTVIHNCRNKFSLYSFFENDNFIKLIPTYELKNFKNENNYPLIVKPKKGRSSEGVFTINNELEFNKVSQLIPKDEYIIQPFLEGDIFTVDIVRSPKYHRVQIIARQELIRNFNGAGLTVKIVSDDKLEKLSRHAVEVLGIKGCVNLEFIQHFDEFYLMDLNPRFSAGIAFSILAGYDVVTNHLNCFLDIPIELKKDFPSIILAKKYEEIILK